MQSAALKTALGALLCLGVLLPGPAGKAATADAQAGAPAAYRADRPVSLTYALFSHGLRAMTLQATLRLTPQGYALTLHDKTTGFIGMMVRTDVTSTAAGRFDGDKVMPISYASSGYSRGADRSTRIDYPGGEPKVAVLTPPDANRDPVPEDETGHSIDTLSAMVGLLHEVAQNGRCDGQEKLFDGLRLSMLTAETKGEEAVPKSDTSPFDTGTALRCDFVGQQIAGFLHNGDEAKVRKPQHGNAWLVPLLPGGPRFPVRVVFEHPRLGQIVAVLTAIDQPAA